MCSSPHVLPFSAQKASHPLLRTPTLNVHFNVEPLNHDPDHLHASVREFEDLLQCRREGGKIMRAAMPSPALSPVAVEKYVDRGVLVTVAPSTFPSGHLPKARFPVVPARVWIQCPDAATRTDYGRPQNSIANPRFECLTSKQIKLNPSSKHAQHSKQPYRQKIRLPQHEYTPW